MQEYDCRMSDSDIHTIFLLSSWAFYHNSFKLRHSICEQSMKESLLTFEDCMKSVHSISLKNWQNNWANESNVELYICRFFNYSQNNWASLLLMTELVINNYNFTSTEVSLFFLSHEYHMKLLQLLEKLKPVRSVKSSVQKADQIVQKMKKATEWAQMTMTVTQQVQKKMMNQKRQQSYNFKKRDKVWLNLKNIHTDHSCKKFDAKNVKYTIVKKISSHFFCLNTLSGIHNVFHSVMLQSAVMNAFFSQYMTDLQPSPQIVSDEEEFKIDKILREKLI